MKIKIYLQIITILSICSAKMVSDFSPIEIGNNWLYHYTESSERDRIYTSKRECSVYLQIMNKRSSNDSVFFTIQRIDTLKHIFIAFPGDTTDSLCDQQLSVKYWEYLEVKGNYCVFDSLSSNLNFSFFYNAVNDSLLTIKNIMGKQLYSYVIFNGIGINSQRTEYIQDIGLVNYNSSSSSSNYNADFYSYKLISFNGNAIVFDSLPIKFSLSKDKKHRINTSSNATYFNLLGSRIKHKNEYKSICFGVYLNKSTKMLNTHSNYTIK